MVVGEPIVGTDHADIATIVGFVGIGIIGFSAILLTCTKTFGLGLGLKFSPRTHFYRLTWHYIYNRLNSSV
jgi:hypothetical protein